MRQSDWISLGQHFGVDRRRFVTCVKGHSHYMGLTQSIKSGRPAPVMDASRDLNSSSAACARRPPCHIGGRGGVQSTSFGRPLAMREDSFPMVSDPHKPTLYVVYIYIYTHSIRTTRSVYISGKRENHTHTRASTWTGRELAKKIVIGR